MLHTLTLKTTEHSQMVNITEQVSKVVQQMGVEEGLITVYCPHTTAGITINEGVDPDVAHDILLHLDAVFPWDHPHCLHREGNSAAHVKASTIGASQMIPIANGKLTLGVWQAIYYCEFDGPRTRTVLIKVLQG